LETGTRELLMLSLNSNTILRAGITLTGTTIISFGIAWMRFSGMGTDPFVTMNIGISHITSVDFGTVQMLANLVILLLMLIYSPLRIHLGTVLGIFFVGFFSDYVLVWLQIFPDTLAFRIVALAIGLLACCFGVALYMTAEMGIAPYDALGMILVEKLGSQASYRGIRIFTDICCVAVGFVLGAQVGIGTFITAFLTGPLINFFRKIIGASLAVSQVR